MHTVTMYKGVEPNHGLRRWFWSLEEVWNDWDAVYSDPFQVELPDNIRVVKGEDGTGLPCTYLLDDNGREWFLGISQNAENGRPRIQNGIDGYMILSVVGPVSGDEA